MTIQRVEKPNMFLSNLLKRILSISAFLICFNTFSQSNASFEFEKLGLQITSISNDRWFVDDPDYRLEGYTFKSQWFYHLRDLGSWDFNIVFQPQIQLLKHKLDNRFFVQPDDFPDDLEAYRDRFVQQRVMSFYAFELGFQLKRSITRDVHFEFVAGLGAGYIDTNTERLAQGFTFVENLSIGFAKTYKKCEIYLGFNLNHISNFDIQLPNSGYDLMGWEIGFRFLQ